MIEAWEEEQMSNMGCESVSDLIAEVKRLRETVKAYLDLDMESLEFCRIMREMGVIE